MPSSLVACTRLAGVWVSPEVVLRVLGNVVDMSGGVVDISFGDFISIFLTLVGLEGVADRLVFELFSGVVSSGFFHL